MNKQLDQLFTLGTVKEVDLEQALINVEYTDNTTGWLPWLPIRAGSVITWSTPTVGEQVIIVTPDDTESPAFVLMSLYQDAFAAPSQSDREHLMLFNDSALIKYNDETHHLQALLPEGGTTTLTSDGGITITGDITLTGNINMTGSLAASGDVSDGTRSMAGDRGIFNDHIHTGDSGGETSPPKTKQ